MTEIFEFILSLTYTFLIVSSVIFGISIGVNIWLSNTVKNVQKEVDKNFSKIDDLEKSKIIENAINKAKLDFNNYVKISKKIERIKKRNKIRKFFKLKEKLLPVNPYDVKLIFNELLLGVYYPFEEDGDEYRGYLSFTEKEIFNVLKSLNKRLGEIFLSSKIVWLSSIKISFIVECVMLSKQIMNFKNKIWVSIILTLLNFFMWFGKLLSPTAISKYYVKSISGDSLNSLLYSTAVEVIGKELAVIYKEQRFTLE